MRTILSYISFALAIPFYGFVITVWAMTIRDWGVKDAMAELLWDWPEAGITLGCLGLGTAFLCAGLSLLGERRLSYPG